MALEIKRREHEGIVILDLTGEIRAGDEAGQFRDAVQGAASSDGARVILNMAGIDYIDSTGLGAIVMSASRVNKTGGAVKLLNLSRRTIELLVMTKLATIFEIFNDEQEAVNSFYPDRKIQKFDILNFLQSHRES
ncbi:MAG: STAS domain-containing protein [Bryobacterales bacterium]|jgi:anti-sigma B factor antagonist|nr:STAS domain-containing protein [Bryobacterales bacterium]